MIEVIAKHLPGIIMLLGLLVFWIWASLSFFRELRFYWRNNWDFSKDSEVKIYMYEEVVKRKIFSTMKIGHRRLVISGAYFCALIMVIQICVKIYFFIF